MEEAWMLKQNKTYKRLYLILVTSMLGAGTFSYIPTVYAESNEALVGGEVQLTNSLSKLEMEGAVLDQTFSTDITAYTATVDNEIDSIQLLVEAASPTSSITINGQTVSNGKSDPLPLQTGENTILITVKDSSNQSETYTLTITRKKNENNLLKNIILSRGVLTPAFDPSITDYHVELGNEADSITINPETFVNTEGIKVNGTVWESKGIAVKFPVGTSEIPILVTAEDGTQKTYLIHITRAAKSNTNKPGTGTTNKPGTGTTNKPGTSSTSWSGNTKPSVSGNTKSFSTGNFSGSMAQQQSNTTVQKASTATLSSLTVSEGTWDSSFSKDEYTYHLALSSNVNSVTINPVSTYSSAAVSIDGSSTKTISLTGTKTVVSILVTKGEDRKTYVLVFERPSVQALTDSSTVSTANQSSANVSTKPKEVSTKVSGIAAQNVRQNKTTTSFWDRIISFFKNIF